MKSPESEVKLPRVAKISIDPTDNRLTHDFGDKNISDEALDLILSSVENFGGKRIFIVQNKELKAKFCARNFHVPEERERFFELKMKSVDVPDSSPDVTFVEDEGLKKYATEESVLDLSKKSGFLDSKIEQYQTQGYAGFQLMCQYSQVFGMVKNDKLVGFCRLTDLGDNNYYLSDTWIDEQAISKEKGAELLYAHFLNTKNKRIFLIAPSGHEEEFKRLGSEIPKDVVMSFVPKGPAMDKLFQDELVKLRSSASPRMTN